MYIEEQCHVRLLKRCKCDCKLTIHAFNLIYRTKSCGKKKKNSRILTIVHQLEEFILQVGNDNFFAAPHRYWWIFYPSPWTSCTIATDRRRMVHVRRIGGDFSILLCHGSDNRVPIVTISHNLWSSVRETVWRRNDHPMGGWKSYGDSEGLLVQPVTQESGHRGMLRGCWCVENSLPATQLNDQLGKLIDGFQLTLWLESRQCLVKRVATVNLWCIWMQKCFLILPCLLSHCCYLVDGNRYSPFLSRSLRDFCHHFYSFNIFYIHWFPRLWQWSKKISFCLVSHHSSFANLKTLM